MVEEEVAEAGRPARLVDRPGRNLGDEGQPLARLQPPRRLDVQYPVAADGAVKVRPALVEAAGIGVPGDRRRPLGQRHAGARLQNRKRPVVAGNVPEDLRLVVDPAHLPVGLVGQNVGIGADIEEHVLVAGIDA